MNGPSITVARTISMGHRLPTYNGICASPHGHNVRVEVVIDTAGAFIDFKNADASLDLILADLDHAMVLHDQDPLLPVLRGFGFRTVALSVEPTTEAIAQLVYNELVQGTWEVDCVVVYETSKYSATVHQLDPHVRRVK